MAKENSIASLKFLIHIHFYVVPSNKSGKLLFQDKKSAETLKNRNSTLHRIHVGRSTPEHSVKSYHTKINQKTLLRSCIKYIHEQN